MGMGGGFGITPEQAEGIKQGIQSRFKTKLDAYLQENFNRTSTAEEFNAWLTKAKTGEDLENVETSAKKEHYKEFFQPIKQQYVDKLINANLQASFGTGDWEVIDKITELKELKNLSKTPTDPKKYKEQIQDAFTAVNNARVTQNMQAFSQEFIKKIGRPPKKEEIDNFLDKHESDTLGLGTFGEKDYKKIYDALDQISSEVGTEIETDYPEEVSEGEGKDEVTVEPGQEPLTRTEIEEKMSKAKDELATELAKGRGTIEERMSKAFTEYEEYIPKHKQELEGILTERFERALPDLQRKMSEEFVSGVGLRTGAFQKTLAEELSQRQKEMESGLAEYQLGAGQQLAQQRLGFQEQLAGMEAEDVRRVGELGFGLEQYGAQMGREDFLAALEAERQREQMQQQADVSMFLNRMGYQQQLAQQGLGYQQQLGTLGRQQQFSMEEAEKQREFTRWQMGEAARLQKEAESRARKQAQSGMWKQALGTIGGMALGGLGGAAIGSMFGGAGRGAAIGAGIFGGQPSLLQYGLMPQSGYGGGGGYQQPPYSYSPYNIGYGSKLNLYDPYGG